MASIDVLNISMYQIHMFIVVCECGSFTKAAQVLNITQSAISKSISSMESILGFPLFERQNKVITLTESGKLLEGQWRSLLQNYNLSIDQAFLMHEREQYCIQVGEPDSMKSDKDYYPNIRAFQEQYKDIKLMFSECPIGELVSRLVSNELDVIITIDYEVPVLETLGLSWTPIADSPYMHIILHKDHPLCERASLSLSDIKDEEVIVPTPIMHQSYIDFIFELCRPYGFKPNISITVPNTRSMMSTLLRSKTGVILGNRFMYDADSTEIKHYELAGTYSRLIIAWKNDYQKPGLSNFIQRLSGSYTPLV